MSSATDAPLVQTTVPAEGQTPPRPATGPQPTALAPRRVTPFAGPTGITGGAWTIGVLATAGGAIGLAFILRTVPALRDVIVFGGLGLLLTVSLIGVVLGWLQ